MAETDQQQQNPEDQESQVSGVLALLLIGASLTATASSVAAFLSLPLAPVLSVLSMMKKGKTKGTTKHTLNVPHITTKKSASQIVSDANNRYRSAFLINSSRRVAEAPDPQAQLERERKFWDMHVQASNRRQFMAKETDVAAETHGPLLGWYSTIDARTTPDCRAADGRNFYAYDPPVIGYPGAVHLRCRCKPGPPHSGGKKVDSSTTVQTSDDASGFEKREGNGLA